MLKEMDKNLGRDSVLYFVQDRSVIPVLESFADANSLWLREAEDVVELYVCDSRFAVVEKSLLDEDLFSCLRSTYLDQLLDDFYKEFPECSDLKFDYNYLVFGKGPEIPQDVKEFFDEVNDLTSDTLVKFILERIKNITN